jgi:hypothetical protein
LKKLGSDKVVSWIGNGFPADPWCQKKKCHKGNKEKSLSAFVVKKYFSQSRKE